MNNKEIVKKIRDKSSLDFQNYVREGSDGSEIIYNASILAEFIENLVEKIIKTDIHNKIYENKLSLFKKGKIEYGGLIEDLFVESPTVLECEFDNDIHYEDNRKDVTLNDTTDLVGSLTTSVKSRMLQVNYEHKARVSFNDSVLKNAFINEDGLQKLIDGITASAVSELLLTEEIDLKNTLKRLAVKLSISDKIDSPNDIFIVETSDIKTETTAGQLIGYRLVDNIINSTAFKLTNKSNEFNMAAVSNFSKIDDLIFITIPAVAGMINYPAIKTIVVDELPSQYISGGDTIECKCYGIVIDKALLSWYTSYETIRSKFNPDKLTHNVFFNRKGLMGCDLFQNIALIVKGEDGVIYYPEGV